MTDPLSIAASIAALLQLSGTVVKYLSDVKDAPEDRRRLMLELSSLKGLLSTLQELVQPGEKWLATVRSLSESNGPLEQCDSLLRDLDEKLAPVVGLKKIRKALSWPFQKNDVNDILLTIERLKTLFGLALDNDHFNLSCAMEKSIIEVRDDVRELRKSQKDQGNRDIVFWLSPLNFYTKQTDYFDRRQNGTGTWLLENETFKKWLSGTERTLWCPGLPGAGKTVLTSIVIDYLERSFARENVAIAYIYCSYKEQEDQTAVSLIASLLQQLVQKNPTVSEDITSLYQKHINKQTRPNLIEFSKLLQLEVGRFSKVFIIVDALDECSENNDTRHRFLTEIRKMQPHIHLLVTSRHISTIDREFETAACVDIRASDQDVRRYLEGRINKESRLARLVKKDSAFLEKIINTITEKAKGMFLLAQLHIDSLATKATLRQVRGALETLPERLDDIYDAAVWRIERQYDADKQLAEQVLFWISYALRPLTIKELQHALAVEPGTSRLDEDNLPDEELLTSVCAGLVTADRESNIIRLVHYTTQEYFQRIRSERFPDAQQNITLTCLTYLSFDVFAEGCCPTDEIFEARLQQNHFLDYAARNWGNHAHGDAKKAAEDLALKFLTDGDKVSGSGQVLLYSRYQRAAIQISGLHLVAYFGLKDLTAKLLLEEDVKPESKDSGGRTPLSWASRYGHEEVVRLLLAADGVDPNSKDNDGHTPLWWAAQNGHETVVRLLLAADGVDSNSKDRFGQTPLSSASRYGHEEVVRLLLAADGVDPDSMDNTGQTPLSWAAWKGHEEVARLLLAADGVDPDSMDSFGQTPLSYAARNGLKAVAKFLLPSVGSQ